MSLIVQPDLKSPQKNAAIPSLAGMAAPGTTQATGLSRRALSLLGLAAVLATDLAGVLAALSAGFALVSAAFLAGTGSHRAGSQNGEGQKREQSFHGFGLVFVG
jgi:hypothetical protein